MAVRDQSNGGGSDQDAAEAAQSPGTEHDQPGVVGLLDQRRHRISGLQLDVDLQFGVCLVYRGLDLNQQLPAIGFQRVEETLGVTEPTGVGGRREVHGVHQP